MLIEEYFNADLFDFYQLLNSDGDLHSSDESAEKFHLTPNKYNSFIKHIKLISAIPNSWLDNSTTTQINFVLFKNKVEEQVAFLGQTSKRTYTFLKDKKRFYRLNNSKNGVIHCKFYQIILTGIEYMKTII